MTCFRATEKFILSCINYRNNFSELLTTYWRKGRWIAFYNYFCGNVEIDFRAVI